MRHYAGHNASCWIGDKKYIDKLKTWFILCKRQCLYLNADDYAEMPMPMMMPRCQCRDFQMDVFWWFQVKISSLIDL